MDMKRTLRHELRDMFAPQPTHRLAIELAFTLAALAVCAALIVGWTLV